MKLTRRVLFAANTQLVAQLAAVNPESYSRKRMRTNFLSARDEADAMRVKVESLEQKNAALAGVLAARDAADAKAAHRG